MRSSKSPRIYWQTSFGHFSSIIGWYSNFGTISITCSFNFTSFSPKSSPYKHFWTTTSNVFNSLLPLPSLPAVKLFVEQPVLRARGLVYFVPKNGERTSYIEIFRCSVKEAEEAKNVQKPCPMHNCFLGKYLLRLWLCKNYLMVYLYVTSIWRVTAACRRYLSFNPLHLQEDENIYTSENTYIRVKKDKMRLLC